MDELNKITRLLRDRVKDTYSAIDLDVNENTPNKEQELLNGIIDGKFLTDKDAAELLYGTNADDQRYRMLKSRLRQRLLNLLYFVDYRDSKTKISTQFEQESTNYIHKAKILLREGLDEIAEKLVNKALAISKETELTEVTLEGLAILRKLNALKCQPATFYKVLNELEHYQKLNVIENKAYNLYYEQRMLVKKSVNSRKKNLDSAINVVNELEKLWKETNSFNIFDFYYILKVICHESVGDYKIILDLTRETEKLVKKKAINPLRFDERFNVFMKTYALLRTRQFEEGLEFMKKSLTYFEKSSSNWFALMENYYLLAVRHKDYDLAGDIIDQVFHNPNMDKLMAKPIQRWKVLRAYMYHIHPNKHLNDIVNFDEFYLSLNVLNQDKNGFNVALMVLEFLHYLIRDEKDKLLDKVERLQKYIYRHLNQGDVTYRDKLFFKLLLVMIDSGFDSNLAQKRGQKLYEKLSTADEPGDAYAEIEIIPYEDLWEHVIAMANKEYATAH